MNFDGLVEMPFNQRTQGVVEWEKRSNGIALPCHKKSAESLGQN